jgi:hypothetical protein
MIQALNSPVQVFTRVIKLYKVCECLVYAVFKAYEMYIIYNILSLYFIKALPLPSKTSNTSQG